MFGMGLNIAAGKFSHTTRLITATKNSENAVIVDVDIQRLVDQKNFQVQPSVAPKGAYFSHGYASGTIIELTNWWRPGSPNSDNPKRLIQNGPGSIRALTLGRRYATLLRTDVEIYRSKLWLEKRHVSPFEHCVWGENRFVKKGILVANPRQATQFSEVLRTQTRCLECGGLAR